MPFDVPKTMEAETAKHVGEPKLRLAVSANAWPLSFFSFVHRTTSHGGEVDSLSLGSSWKLEVNEILRPWPCENAGEPGREPWMLPEDMREEKRRSKGRNDGAGPLR